jgi:hypothetical protein
VHAPVIGIAIFNAKRFRILLASRKLSRQAETGEVRQTILLNGFHYSGLRPCAY